MACGRGWLLFALVLACAAAWPDYYGSNFPQTDPNRYIVKFAGNPNLGKATLQARGATIIHDHPLINAATVSLPAESVQQIADSGHIQFMERDVPRWLMGGSQVTPYGITMVQADQLSEGTYNHTICIIDSGLDVNHEDLVGLTVSGYGNVSFWGFDGCGHGTHVSGTIGARNNNIGVVGVTQNVAIYMVKVFDSTCIWNNVYASDLMTAGQRCLNTGLSQITISMSLGCSSADDSQCSSLAEQQFFDAAYAAGHLIVAAAGNGGNSWNSYPASYDSVISVAAVDDTMTWASFSQTNPKVEIAAPGVDVLSTYPVGAAESASLIVNGVAYSAINIDESPEATVTGPLVNCGLAISQCTGVSGAICLILRGTDTFAQKVLNCQNGGGIGAIIYNNVTGNFDGTLGGVTTTIPSASIALADGQTLAASLGTATLSIQAANYAFLSGTSMSTPHVSGTLAKVWSHNPAWTNAQLRSVMQTTTIPCTGQTGKNTQCGYGIIQGKNMLTALQATTAAPATTATATTTTVPPTTTPSPTGTHYLGCYADASTRDLNATWTQSAQMTPATCSNFCAGYPYYALQLGSYCFCGTGYGKYGNSTGCVSACAGNSSLVCGGFWSNSVYANPVYLGCYIDESNRDLNATWESSALMTPTLCQNFCVGYSYWGLQLGSYCFCGTGYGKYGSSTGCGSACAGNSSLICGGFWLNSVYGYPH